MIKATLPLSRSFKMMSQLVRRILRKLIGTSITGILLKVLSDLGQFYKFQVLLINC